MRKIHLLVMASVALYLPCFISGGSAYGQPLTIIADHTVVSQYDAIPQVWIDEVKKMLITIPGESHGRGYMYGLELVEQLDSTKFAVNITWDGEPESPTDSHLRAVRTYWTGSGWSGSGGEEDFWTNTAAQTMMLSSLQLLQTSSNPVSAFGFGWCWDMTWQNAPTTARDPVYGCGWAGSTEGGPEGSLAWGLDDEDSAITGNSVNLDDYLTAVQWYNTSHPQAVTFFTTGPVDTEAWTERGFQRDIKHQAIRQFVHDNGGVLFDYADILTHDSAGEKYIYGAWTDYEGVQHDVDYIDPENSGNYDGGMGACHIGEEGCLKLGKAMWWMLARVAGWEGTPIFADGFESGDTSQWSATAP